MLCVMDSLFFFYYIKEEKQVSTHSVNFLGQLNNLLHFIPHQWITVYSLKKNDFAKLISQVE